MGFQWQQRNRRRVGGRGPRSFAPTIARFRRPNGDGVSGWLGFASVVGLALVAGLVGAWWPAGADDGGGWSTNPIEWNTVQAMPRGEISPDDQAWLERARDDGGAPESAGATDGARFGLCHSGGGTNCVVDGDTLWIGGQNVRLADIDAPETHEPRCAAEQALGDRATRRLHELVNGGAVTLAIIDRDEDRYGRKLRIVAVGGASVGETLVGEGLARWYAGGRRSWCG